MKAKKKPLVIEQAGDLGVDPAPRLEILRVSEPGTRKAGVMVPDVAALVEKLRHEARVI